MKWLAIALIGITALQVLVMLGCMYVGSAMPGSQPTLWDLGLSAMLGAGVTGLPAMWAIFAWSES